MFSDELLKQIQDRTTPEQQRNMENATPSWVTDTPAIVTDYQGALNILNNLLNENGK